MWLLNGSLTFVFLQVLLVTISCIGWVSNHFTGIKFPNQSDVSAAVGALAVGFVANLYARFFQKNAFVIMVCLSFYSVVLICSPTEAMVSSLVLLLVDHRHPVSAPVGRRERRAVHVRVQEGRRPVVI